MARRDERAYREYVREEQRRQPGCPARELCRESRGRDTRLMSRRSSGGARRRGGRIRGLVIRIPRVLWLGLAAAIAAEGAVGLGLLAYWWSAFSGPIDQRLHGERDRVLPRLREDDEPGADRADAGLHDLQRDRRDLSGGHRARPHGEARRDRPRDGRIRSGGRSSRGGGG